MMYLHGFQISLASHIKSKQIVMELIDNEIDWYNGLQMGEWRFQLVFINFYEKWWHISMHIHV